MSEYDYSDIGGTRVTKSLYDYSDLGGVKVTPKKKSAPQDPNLAFEQSGKLWDTSVKTGVPVSELEQIRDVVQANGFWARDPSFYEEYIQPYIPTALESWVKNELLTVRPETKNAVMTAIQTPPYLAGKYISGLSLGAPELLAGKPLEEFSGMENLRPEVKQFAGGIKTIGKAVSTALSKLPVRYGLKAILAGELTFGLREADEEFVNKLTTGDPVDWEGISFETGIGGLFGAGEVGIQKALQFMRGYLAGTNIVVSKLPPETREAERLNMRKEVQDALNEYRTTGDRTNWDKVRDKYMGLKKGEMPVQETKVKSEQATAKGEFWRNGKPQDGLVMTGGQTGERVPVGTQAERPQLILPDIAGTDIVPMSNHPLYSEPIIPQKQTDWKEAVKNELLSPELAKKIPISGGLVEIEEYSDVAGAAKRLKSGNYDYKKPVKYQPSSPVLGTDILLGLTQQPSPVFSSKEQDEKMVADFIEKANKDYTFGGKLVKGVSVLPTWMTEFALTGGLANIGSKAAKEAAFQLLQKQAKTSAGKMALKAAGWTGGALSRTALGLAPRVGGEATERRAEIATGLRDNEGLATSIAKSFGDVYIESLSETAGDGITKLGGKALGVTNFGRKFVSGLENTWTKITGGSKGEFARQLMTKAGYSNILGEIGEERLGTILRAVTDVEDFGAGKDSNIIDRIAAGLREDIKNIGVEAAVWSVPMGAQALLGRSLNSINRATAKEGQPPVIERSTQGESVIEPIKAYHGTTNSAAASQQGKPEAQSSFNPPATTEGGEKIVENIEPIKETINEEETIIEPAPSVEVDAGQAGRTVPEVQTTGKLDPTNYEDAIKLTEYHANWVEGGGKYRTRNNFQGIRFGQEVEYTAKQIEEAYRTVQTEIDSPMPDTKLYAMPNKEKELRAIADKMAKVKGTVPQKSGKPKTFKPTKILPKVATEPKDVIKGIYKAAAKESTRYALNGVYVEGDNIVATDGRRMFVAKGKWGKDGIYIDPKSLKEGSLGKPSIGKDAEGNEVRFPKWQDVIPTDYDARDVIVINDLEITARRARQAALIATEESAGIMIIKNKDGSLGFACAAPEVGHSEINVNKGGQILGAVNPQYFIESLQFHAARGDKRIEFSFPNPERPILTKDPYGKTLTVTMPVKIRDTPEEVQRIIEDKQKAIEGNKSDKPSVGGRNAGFVYIPPMSIDAKLAEDHPNIKIDRKKNDLTVLQRNLSLSQQAWNTKNPNIIAASEEMLDRGMVINNDIAFAINTDKHFYDTLPKDFKGKNEDKFFDLMDETISPSEIRASTDIPDKVKDSLIHFKEQEELMRQEIIKYKAEKLSAYYQTKSLSELQDMANNLNIPITKQGVTKIVNRTKAEISKDIADIQGQKWGMEYGHIQHIFFGQYSLTYTGTDGVTHFIGRAETAQEAADKLIAFKKLREAEGFNDADKIILKADTEIELPLDVTRLSTPAYRRLLSQLKESANIESGKIQDAVRGVVGLKRSKEKWWGALQQRKGAEGFSKEFWRVWEAEVTQFTKWKHLTEMNKIVEPLIEKVRADGYTQWANWLSETKDYMWGKSRSKSGISFDQYLQKIPVVKDYVKPYALERWTGAIKTINYWRHLQTPKFGIINSLQIFQTLYPVVGEKGIFNAQKLYYSAEGQGILRDHKVIGISGKLHELGFRAGKDWQKYTPAGASEKRNQGVAFLALYDYAKNQLKMPEELAARHARLRGQLMTQYAYSPADIPDMMRGPIVGTILQYRRFSIKSMELISRMVREGNFAGVCRFVGVQVLLGGMRTLLSPLSAIGLGYLGYESYNWVKEQAGEEVADVIHYGLPAIIGVDASSSIDIVPQFYGRNIAEKIGNQFVGPAGQTVIRLVTDLTSTDKTEDFTVAETLMRSLSDSSPAAKQFVYLVKALDKDTNVMDVQGRLKYREEVWDLWKKAFALTPVEETKARDQMEAMLNIKEEYDKVCDSIATAIISGNGEKASNLILRWSAMYPESPINGEAIKSRVMNKVGNRVLTQEERMFLQSPKPLKSKTSELITQ